VSEATTVVAAPRSSPCAVDVRAHLSAPFPNLQPPLLWTKPQLHAPTISVHGSVSVPRARPSKGSVTPSTPFPSPVSPRSHSLEHPRKLQWRPTEASSAQPRRSSSPSCLDSIYPLGELRLASIFLLMPSFSRMVAPRAVFTSFGESPSRPAMASA
jgi:hypothetical protein